MPDQTAAARQYRYFIGWTDGATTGGTDISRELPIRNIDTVQGVQQMLRKHYRKPTLTVTSFSRYDD